MLLTVVTGSTSHGVEPPATSGKSQEEEISSLSMCIYAVRGMDRYTHWEV